MKDKINKLIKEILKIPGQKIVTLISSGDIHEFDISQENQIGHSPEHRFLFEVKLATALQHGGGMTIRQFLSVRTKRKMPNGKEIWIPEKNLYGVILRNGDWFGMDIINLKLAYETDAKTGRPLKREIGTHYRDFPIK